MIRTLMEARDKNKAVDNAIGKKGGKLCGKDAQSAMYWGDSDVMNNLRSIVEKVAATDANILITDENGKIVTHGDRIKLGGNELYTAMCHSCWKKAQKQ